MATWTYSGNVYDASPAGTTTFPLTSEAGNPIGYLQRSHIHVYKSADSGVTYTTLTFSTDYNFNTAGTSIVLTSGISTGEWIKLQRITPYKTEYVKYQASSQLTADQLNTGEKFSMYVEQEVYDDIAVAVEPFIGDAPDDGELYGRKSEAWAKVPPPGIYDAPSDNQEYVRLNSEWVVNTDEGIGEAPVNSKTYGRRDAAWSEIVIKAGIVYKGTRDLTKAAPADSDDGDLYINTATSGEAAASWTGIAGDTLKGSERVIYDGTDWDLLPSDGGGGATVEVRDTPPADPTEGDLWWDSNVDSGKLYVWYKDKDSSQWVEANPSAAGGSGDLQTVTDAGNTTTNGAKFADGDIELKTNGSIIAVTNSRQPIDSALVLNNTNTDGYSIYSQSDGTGKFAVSTNGTVLIGDPGAAAQNVRLSADGSGTFAGDVQSGGDTASSDGVVLRDIGLVKAARSTGASAVFAGYTTGVSTATSEIDADGTATFTGRTTCGTTSLNDYAVVAYSDSVKYGGIYSQNNNDSGNLFVGQGPSGEVIAFDADGTGTFAGTVTSANTFAIQLATEDESQYETSTETYTDTETYTGPLGNSLTRDVENTREIKTYVGPVLNVRDELQALRYRATQQDETIKLMTSALKSLGADVSAFPAPESEQT